MCTGVHFKLFVQRTVLDNLNRMRPEQVTACGLKADITRLVNSRLTSKDAT